MLPFHISIALIETESLPVTISIDVQFGSFYASFDNIQVGSIPTLYILIPQIFVGFDNALSSLSPSSDNALIWVHGSSPIGAVQDVANIFNTLETVLSLLNALSGSLDISPSDLFSGNNDDAGKLVNDLDNFITAVKVISSFVSGNDHIAFQKGESIGSLWLVTRRPITASNILIEFWENAIDSVICIMHCCEYAYTLRFWTSRIWMGWMVSEHFNLKQQWY